LKFIFPQALVFKAIEDVGCRNFVSPTLAVGLVQCVILGQSHAE